MSDATVLLVERDRVCVIDAADCVVTELATDLASGPERRDSAYAFGALAQAVRDLTGARTSPPRALVVVIGASLLEIATPSLPPVSDLVKARMLAREPDRYFPTEQPVAVAWHAPFAVAVPAAVLDGIIAALESVAPVTAVTSIVELLSRGGVAGMVADGTITAGYGNGERVIAAMANGTVMSIAREYDDGPAALAGDVGTSVGAVPSTANQPLRTSGQASPTRELLREPWIVAVADATGALAVDAMLLSPTIRKRFVAKRRRQWVRSGALVVGAAALFVFALDRYRERGLVSTLAALQRARVAAEPAALARGRIDAAASELRALSAGVTGRAPNIVLARLGALLPADAFVQRVEWDGNVWRIDGSASDAPRLIPLLDGDSTFTDVRIAAASTRFTEDGRQRESFSIAFRTRAPALAPQSRAASMSPTRESVVAR